MKLILVERFSRKERRLGAISPRTSMSAGVPSLALARPFANKLARNFVFCAAGMLIAGSASYAPDSYAQQSQETESKVGNDQFPESERAPGREWVDEDGRLFRENENGELVPVSGSDDKRPRQGQNIDEPNLDPMFGRRSDDDPDEVEDENDDTEDRRPRAARLTEFTGLLTFLAPADTQLSLGAGPVIKPDYFGSNDYEVEVDPQVYIALQNFVFFDDEGADFALLGFSGFRIGPSIRIVGDRTEDENPALVGLGDVGETFELGGFASTTFLDRYSVKFKVRKGIATGHRGLIVDAFGTALLFRYGRFSTSVTAKTSWIGDDYADTYFTVSPTQAANSGLQEFDARSGFRNIGGSLNGYVNLGTRWSLNPYVSYDRVIGNIRETPIIADFGSPNQFRFGFHLIRQFEIF